MDHHHSPSNMVTSVRCTSSKLVFEQIASTSLRSPSVHHRHHHQVTRLQVCGVHAVKIVLEQIASTSLRSHHHVTWVQVCGVHAVKVVFEQIASTSKK